MLAGTSGGNTERCLVWAHGPDVPDGYVLTNATLYLYQDLASPSGYGKVMDLYRVLTNWTHSAATWASNTASTTWTAPGLAAGSDYVAAATATATTPASNAFTVFNVTSNVLAFIAGSATNCGWLCRAHTESQLVRFRTIEDTTKTIWPYIVYEYDTPPVIGTIVTNLVDADTEIGNLNANTNYGTANNVVMGNSGGSVYRALIRGPLTGIPAHAIVLNASLRVYSDWRDGLKNLVDLHRVLKNWNEYEATWNSNMVASAWASPGLESGADYAAAITDTSYMPTNAFAYFDVTTDMRAFLQGTANNYGWAAINQNEAGGPVRFRSREDITVDQRPYLIIRYSIPSGTMVAIK
jgi:hypothetical protein